MAFRFCDFDAVGFDVDHAFVQYKLENLFPVSCLSCTSLDGIMAA
jgi:hypothetical protein